MNDKTNDPQEKSETAIDSEELRDDALDQAVGGLSDIRWESQDDPRKSGVSERKASTGWSDGDWNGDGEVGT